MAIFSFVLGAAVAAAIPQPAARPAFSLGPPAAALPAPRPDNPALWVVNDQDTIIYLFGTFHALDRNSRWFGPTVRAAFSESDELMLETLVPSLGFSRPPRPIRPADGTVAPLAPSASFTASTKMVMNAGRNKGLSIDNGADAVLRAAADFAGKPVGGLESFDSQLRMFSALPGSASAEPPRQDPRTMQALGSMLTRLQAGWNRGAVEETFTPLLRQMQTQSPDTYRMMFVERNARWADWIAERLKSPGTVFVAVGAGHLSGPDSVQNKLAHLGVKSERVN